MKLADLTSSRASANGMISVKVCVLKVDNDKANLDELAASVAAGRTVEGWEMPKHAEPGDLAVWYASDPKQDYVAWGWVAGIPTPGFRGSLRRYTGPVAGMRSIEPLSRIDVAAASGFNRDPNSVVPQPQTVPPRMAGNFLRALGLDPELLEVISAEVAAVLRGSLL